MTMVSIGSGNSGFDIFSTGVLSIFTRVKPWVYSWTACSHQKCLGMAIFGLTCLVTSRALDGATP